MNGANENSKAVMRIDIIQYALIVAKKWWIILLAAVVCASCLFVYAKSNSVSTYTADGMMYVNNSSVTVGSASVTLTASQVSASRSLLEVYVVILNSRLTLDKINESAGTNLSYSSLRSMITAAAVDETAVMKVSVTASDPYTAMKLTEAVMKVLPEQIGLIIKGSSVEIVDNPMMPEASTNDTTAKSTALGFIVGAVVSIALILLFALLNDRLHSEDWLVQAYGDSIPLLAVIPETDNSSRRGHGTRYTSYYASSSKSDGNKDNS